jgi:hypothetical protein
VKCLTRAHHLFWVSKLLSTLNLYRYVAAAAWYIERVGNSAMMMGAGQEAAGHYEKAIDLVTLGFAGSDLAGMTLPESLGGWVRGSVASGDVTVETRVTPERFASWWRCAAQGWMMVNNHDEALRCLSGVADSIGAPLPSAGTDVHSGGCFFRSALGGAGQVEFSRPIAWKRLVPTLATEM